MSHFEPAGEALLWYETGGRGDGAPHQDPLGGYTRWGIAQRYWPEVAVDELSKQDALTWYFVTYWTPFGLVRLEAQRLATMMLLAVVNMHSRDAVRALQRACRFAETAGVERPLEDGRLGPITTTAANALDPLYLSHALEAELIREYAERVDEPHEAHKRPFLRGWINRVTLRGMPEAIWQAAAALTEEPE